MQKKFMLALVLFISFTSVFSQNKYEWKEATSGGYTYKYVANDPMQARYYTLKNGLTVILSVNKDEPRLQTFIVTKAGSKNDPADHTGLAHYLEHMLFKGTDQYGTKDWSQEKPLLDQIESLYEVYNHTTDIEKRKVIYQQIDSVSGKAATYSIANEYDKMMSNIGAKGTNAFTSFEQTAYVNDIPTNQIDKWLTIEAERFRNPVLRLFHTELEAVYEEKNIGMDEDDTKVFETLFSSLFTNHNYGKQTTIGTIEHLKNPSLIAIKDFYNKNYIPNNMAIILAGDLDPDATIKKIEEHFSFMEAKPVNEYKFTPETPITAPIVKTVVGPDAEYVEMAYRFPGANTKDAQLLDLMGSILSNGTAGLMDLNLVLKQKVLSCSAGSWALKDYSVLFIDGKAKEGQSLEEVRKLLVDQINNLKTGNFDENIIKAVVSNYKRQLIETNESNGGRAYTLLNSFTSGTNWADVLATTDYMSTLTKKDIMAFADKYLQDNYVCIYKKTGEDKNVVKVEKPPITPVAVNRDDQSTFLKNVLAMPVTPIQPVFLNFNKDIQKAQIKQAPVYTVKNSDNQLFNLYYVFDMGKNNDKKLPLAIEYLQYLGTDKLSAESINKEFYKLACNFGVSSGNDQVYVSLSGLQENFEPALQLFENLLSNAKADDKALEGMIADMIKQRADDKLNKDKISYEGLMSYAIFGAKNPFNDVISNADLQKIKSADLVNMIHQLTKYQHQILYYGPQSNLEFTNLLAAYHRIPDALLPVPTAIEYPFQKTEENQLYFAHYDGMKQAQITWTRRAGDFTPTNIPIANLFNEYFGNGMSAIVFQTIRESKALAYSTFSTYRIPKKKTDPFTTFSFVGTQADKFNDATAAMNELLNVLPESPKLFEAAKISLSNNISTTRITKSNILFTYLKAQKLGIDYDIRASVFEKLNTFTFDDINKFHDINYSAKPYTYTVLGDKTKVKEADLMKLGKVTYLSLENIFGY
jgi:predicted Zn-dependent peptidase